MVPALPVPPEHAGNSADIPRACANATSALPFRNVRRSAVWLISQRNLSRCRSPANPAPYPDARDGAKSQRIRQSYSRFACVATNLRHTPWRPPSLHGCGAEYYRQREQHLVSFGGSATVQRGNPAHDLNLSVTQHTRIRIEMPKTHAAQPNFRFRAGSVRVSALADFGADVDPSGVTRFGVCGECPGCRGVFDVVAAGGGGYGRRVRQVADARRPEQGGRCSSSRGPDATARPVSNRLSYNRSDPSPSQRISMQHAGRFRRPAVLPRYAADRAVCGVPVQVSAVRCSVNRAECIRYASESGPEAR